MKIKSLIFLCLILFSFDAASLEACAKSTGNGGKTSAIVKVSLPFNNTASQNWAIVAQAAQSTIGSNAAFDSESGIYLSFNATVGGYPAPMQPISIMFTGNTSLEKSMLNSRNIDKNKSDPNPCDPEKNGENGSEAGGGGGGGGSIIGGPILLPAVPIYVNGRCVSNCDGRTPVVIVERV